MSPQKQPSCAVQCKQQSSQRRHNRTLTVHRSYDLTAGTGCRSVWSTSTATNAVAVTRTSGAVVTTSTSLSLGGVILIAPGSAIQVRWASSDLPRLATDPLAYGRTVSLAPTTPAQNSTTPEPSPGGGGLSTGAKIGIGLGVPFGVGALALLGFILFYLRRRRSSQREEGTRAPPVDYAPQPGAHMQQQEQYHHPTPLLAPHQDPFSSSNSSNHPGSPGLPPGVSIAEKNALGGYYPSNPQFPSPATYANSASGAAYPPSASGGYAGSSPGSNPAGPALAGAAMGSPEHHRRVSSSPTGYSEFAPEVVIPGDAEEFARLKAEQDRIRERKSRLMELERLDEEERRIQAQMGVTREMP